MLKRFLDAQKGMYEQALYEIRSGHKDSCWIWYIFPQLRLLGRSDTAQKYGIHNLDEAKEYLNNTTLRNRILEISKSLLDLPEKDPVSIMGCIDAEKLKSSMTLFSVASPDCSVFSDVLQKFFNGEKDIRTLQILEIDTKRKELITYLSSLNERGIVFSYDLHDHKKKKILNELNAKCEEYISYIYLRRELYNYLGYDYILIMSVERSELFHAKSEGMLNMETTLLIEIFHILQELAKYKFNLRYK